MNYILHISYHIICIIGALIKIFVIKNTDLSSHIMTIVVLF